MRRSDQFLACSRTLSLLTLGGLALLGCPSDDTTTMDEVGDDTTESMDTATDDLTDEATDTSNELCGNGMIDGAEQCDDGNTVDDDGCSSTCEVTACGLSWTWMEAIEAGSPSGYSVEVDAMGNVYTTGESEAGTVWVAKWDNTGALVWEQELGEDAYGADLAVDDAGDVFVVGATTADGDDIWYARLSGVDGSEVWSQTIASMMPGEDDYGTGIAIVNADELIVVGRQRVADGDDDVWVSKVSADGGDAIWTSTWSGTGDGTYSTDRTGGVVVTSDGHVWVGAREHVDFDTQEGTLLHFDEVGDLVGAIQPLADAASHQHEPYQVATDGTNVYFLIAKFDFPYRSWLYKLDGSGAEQWVKTEDQWVVVGEDWVIEGLGVDGGGNLLVTGEFTNEEPGEGLVWGEAWVAKLDGAGEFVCRSSHMVDDGDIIPPSLNVTAGGGSAGGMAITGVLEDNPTNSLWTGFFQL